MSESRVGKTYREMYDPENTILVDFDGTLTPFSWPNAPGEPHLGAIRMLRRLKDQGFRIVIFTARAWPGWAVVEDQDFYVDQLLELEDWLFRNDVPHDFVTCEKIPALFILDDRAIHVPADPPENWWSIVEHTIVNARGKGKYGSIRREKVSE